MRIDWSLSAIARWMACEIHIIAYVEKRKPLRQSNFSTARMRPSIPSWTRSASSSDVPLPHFAATDSTRRTLQRISSSFASRSPRSIRLASAISSGPVSSL